MSPYREPGKPLEDPPEEPEDQICACGHPASKHRWFNSEFIGCTAEGYYNTTIRGNEVLKHQMEEICKCERFVHRCETPLIKSLEAVLTDLGNSAAFQAFEPKRSPEAADYLVSSRTRLREIIEGLKKGK